MAIDYDAVFDCFIEIARNGVGSQLATIGPTGTEFPAVIKARQPGPQLDMPYIQLDLIGTTQTEYFLQGYAINPEDDTEVIYETPYKLLLQYSIFGGNAQAIAHDLEAYFRLPDVLDKIETDTTGTLEETFGIDSLPEQLATNKWLEVAQFNLTFNIVDRYISSTDGTIRTISIDGEVFRDENDPDPLEFNVTEPPPP